jgi:MFS family permease
MLFHHCNFDDVFMNKHNDDSTSTNDTKQLGLFAALASLSYVFWICGGMELVERLAYYGVKATATLYAKDPVSKGGLGINLNEFGTILMVWALLQSFIPVFTGGLSDRYGYKQTIFASTITKIAGYLIMGFFPTYWGFFMGAIVLATGTGIFKPGIQGTLVKTTSRKNSSMAWGVFYQTVNIGGWMGPLVAAQLRILAWENVFFACAGIISINFLFLLMYKEPGKQKRLDEAKRKKDSGEVNKPLWKEALHELKNPVLIYYMIIFSGFWFMFNALFDVLPAHIDDWVDTSTIIKDLFGAVGTTSSFWHFLLGMNTDHSISPEGLLNLNAGLIMITCFLFAALSAKMRAPTSMLVGTMLATAALFIIGSFSWAWFCVIGILTFSVGEMLSSPKSSEFIGNIAPPDKTAMYLGFTQLPLGIGWTLEGKIGPSLYHAFASKDSFSRDLLVDKGMAQNLVDQIPQGEAFDKLVEFTHLPVSQLTQTLYDTHNIGMVWYIMGAVGVVTCIGLFFYARWIYSMHKQELA